MELKPDFERSEERYIAFWERSVIDRPLACFQFLSENPKPVPEKKYSTHRERWLDVEFRAEQKAIELGNYEYLGDALPVAWPNMGPEIFSVWCGCGYDYGERTTWTEPCVFDWEADYAKASFDPAHPLFKLTDRFTDLLLERAKGRFIVGLTDFHPGGDHIAALRDPAVLAVDMIENVEWVKRKLEDSAVEYRQAYDHFFKKLTAADMPITSWTQLIHRGRYYIPSNDFSCMISPAMFEDVFLPGIVEECRFYERSIYHLDGPGALKHLDALLAIEELDAVQWVPGAGNEGFTRWIDVYRRIQRAGKALQIASITVDEMDALFENLTPEGVFISGFSGVRDREHAAEILTRLERWR